MLKISFPSKDARKTYLAGLRCGALDLTVSVPMSFSIASLVAQRPTRVSRTLAVFEHHDKGGKGPQCHMHHIIKTAE